MLKIIRFIFLTVLMIMSFFAGIIINKSKLINNYKTNVEFDLITEDEEANKINESKKESAEEDAPKINESEIEDNYESIEIENNNQNIKNI